MFELVSIADFNQLILLYLVELISLIYLLRKYNKSAFFVLIIIIFFPAIFSFIGKNFQDFYKIGVLILVLKVLINKNTFRFKKGDAMLSFLFAAFSLYYFFSASQNNDNLTIIFSQYSRYLVVFCLWFIIRKELYFNNEKTEDLTKLIYDILLIQIIITISKMLIFGGKQVEALVGSLSHAGGSIGTTLPILGFIFLWFFRRGKFELKDWLFVAGLMSIGFMAGKRAIWFMMPLVIAAFMIYIPKLKLNSTLLVSMLMAPLAFYFGARLTPNMNPENKVWGSFDYEHVFDFADKYQFGDKNKVNEKRAQGRGGATLLLWNKLISDDNLIDKDWLGKGLSSFYATSYDDFNKNNTGINMKGSSTGVFQTYLTTGYLGILFILPFFIALLWRIKMKRIRWVLMSIITWEYFMYIGDIFRTPAFMFLIIYFIHYSNYLMLLKPKIQQSSLFIPNQNKNNGSLVKSPYNQNQ